MKFKNLASTNLAILAIRLVEFFFAGLEVGLMGYFIKQEMGAHRDASSPYVFVLVVGVVTMITQFVYCFNIYHVHLFLWDAAIATGWLVSFFWLLNAESPIPCKWNAFNPFGTDNCGQVRAVLILQIVLAVLWYITALLGLWSLIKARRKNNLVGGDVI